MVDTPWGPLPDAAGEYPVRRGKFIDVEVIGSLSAGGSLSGGTITGSTIIGADLYSDNWVPGGGTVPLSLPDASAATGWALDGSAGDSQFSGDVWVLGDIRLLGSGLISTGTSSDLPRIEIESIANGNAIFFRADSAEILNDAQIYNYDAAGVLGIQMTGPNLEDSVNGQFGYATLRLATVSDGTQTYGQLTADGFEGMDAHSSVSADTSHSSGTAGDATVSISATADDGGNAYTTVKSLSTSGTSYVYLRADSTWVGNEAGTSYFHFDPATPAFNVLGGRITSTSAGSVSAPTIGLNTSKNIGFYTPDTSSMAVSIGGLQRGLFGLGGLDMASGTPGTGNARLATGTSVSAPGFTFVSDGDTGMYRVAADDLGFTVGGTSMLRLNSLAANNITWSASGTTNYSVRWDTSSNQLSFVVNGTTEFLLGNTGFNVQNVYDVDANAASQQSVYVNNDGRLHIDTSTLRNKPDWSDASGLAAITLRPIAFTKDGVPSLGFGAEHLAEEDDRLVSYDAGGLPLNYRDRAVLAVLAAKVNRLERTILNAV